MNKLLSVIVLIFLLFHMSEASADPNLVIKANDMTSKASVTTNDTVVISVAMTTSELSGQLADWWAAYLVGEDLYTLSYPSGWQAGISPAYQGALIDLPEVTIFEGKLPAGNYTFFFGVDTAMNGVIDSDQLYFTFVRVDVSSGPSPVGHYFYSTGSNCLEYWFHGILEVNGDGTFVVTRHGDIVYSGTWTQSGDMITIYFDDGDIADGKICEGYGRKGMEGRFWYFYDCWTAVDTKGNDTWNVGASADTMDWVQDVDCYPGVTMYMINWLI